MDQNPHQIYFGKVFHQRKRPLQHGFRYSVFTCLLDLDHLNALPKTAKGFGYNRFGLFSFYDKDHGPRDGNSLRSWVEAQLAQRGITKTCQGIRLLCYPRILGYVFNPLSVYYCYDESGSLFATIYEVKNTFGEQETYVCEVLREEDGAVMAQRAAKTFHVSPFIDLRGAYTFRFNEPGDQLSLQIRHDGPDTLLLTSVTGTARALRTATLFKCFFSYPLMTLKVISAIHFEALRLWRKGAKVFPHPKYMADTTKRTGPSAGK
ncbi:MAG: DUF1365 domain-containing protein [Alphaproteobacteria bacterium]|nr:MAG: DUF1365 domain-containing protein [Alphaproteobacteria bacterium]